MTLIEQKKVLQDIQERRQLDRYVHFSACKFSDNQFRILCSSHLVDTFSRGNESINIIIVLLIIVIKRQ